MTMTVTSRGSTLDRLAGQRPMLLEMLHEQRHFRLAQLAGLRGQAAAMEYRADALDAAADDARRQVDVMLAVAAEQALADIDASLAAMEAGTYGRCGACNFDIPLERLEIMPQAGLCVPCQRSNESRR